MLDVVSITVYDRDTLLNIGSSVAQRKPDFEFLNAGGLFTDTAAEPFVWVAKSTRRRRRRKKGIRAGVLVRLRRRAFRPPLPTILLANVQSLDNKLCELRARISYQRETRDCCVICLTETWMSAIVPDSAIELTGFSVHRSDRTKELTGKSRGGGVCFYINNSWCNERNIHSIKSFCSPDLEFHTLLCRPFWLPREFTAIIITAVYIPSPSQHRPGTQGTVQEYKWAGNRAPRCSFQHTSPSTHVEIVHSTIVTPPSGTHTSPSPAHLSANRITLPFCSCLLIGRNWNVKHPPSGQFIAGPTNRTLYYRTVLITWTGTCSGQRLKMT